MKWLHGLILLTCLLLSANGEENSSETNEIDPKEAVKNLDPSVRQALLRAIDNLEKRAKEEYDYEEDESSTGNEEILDESTKSGNNLLKSLLDIVASQKKYINNPNSTFEIANLLEKTALQANSNELPSSVPSEVTNEISNLNHNFNVSTRAPFIPTRKRTTTEATTTTKKPAPTHNADGENIEVVEKQDIKIFEAPLITAFTVKQDEKGSDKQVIPIFEPPPLPAVSGPQSILTGPAIDSTNTHSTSVLLPTPVPSQTLPDSSPAVPKTNLQQRFPLLSFLGANPIRNQSLPSTDTIPFNQIQPEASLFPNQQSLPLTPITTSAGQSINEFLLEKQRQLEQLILQLQAQARRQQEQILLQQQLLLGQQRQQQFIDPDGLNQVKPPKTSKSNVTVRPSLEVVSSVTQAPIFEYSIEQQLPQLEAVNFRQGFSLHNQPQHHQRSSIQIQQSNQIPFNPSNQFVPPLLPVPLEAASFQHLPQRSYQPFNILPSSGSLNPNHSITKILSADQPPHRTRHFRQESGIGNFGFNNFFNQDTLTPPFGSGTSSKPIVEDLNIINKVLAINHGISPFTPQNLHYTGQFGGFF